MPLDVVWRCNICGKPHKESLLKGLNDVKDEYTLEGCRPDIAPIYEKDVVYAIIEIVDSHELEQKVLNYCSKYNIVLIKIDTINDLENTENKKNAPQM